MILGDKIAIFGVELIIKGGLVTVDNASAPLSSYKDEIVGIINSIPLQSSSYSKETAHFKIVVDTPLTFDVVFLTPVRRSQVVIEREIHTKDQNGLISSNSVIIDPNSSAYVSVLGQIFRAEYLLRLYSMIESSTQKTVLIAEVNNKLSQLYETATILGPAPDECFASVDGGLYLYRDTISSVSDFFISIPYQELPPQAVADFSFMRRESLAGLYSLPGYTPGMSSGIEAALTSRGALGKLDDNSMWLNVVSTLATTVEVPVSLSNIIAYESPRILAFVTLARKVSLANSEISLSALDANTMSFFKTLRKIANKSDLVVLSTNELVTDIIELAPFISADSSVVEDFIVLTSKFLGVTKTEVEFQPLCSESDKRLLRLALGQWRYDYSGITGLVPTTVGNVVEFRKAGVLIGKIIFSGPFSSRLAVIEIKRSAGVQAVVDALAATSGLIDTANLSKSFAVSPATGELSFSYTIDQLKQAVAEILVDTTRSLYRRR